MTAFALPWRSLFGESALPHLAREQSACQACRPHQLAIVAVAIPRFYFPTLEALSSLNFLDSVQYSEDSTVFLQKTPSLGPLVRLTATI